VTTSPPRERSVLQKIDHGVYQAERWLAGGLFLLMVVVMFLMVTQRVFSRPEGRLGVWLIDRFGIEPAFAYGTLSTIIHLAVTFVLCLAAFVTMKPLRGGKLKLWLAIPGAVGATGILVGYVKLVLWFFPNGLIWGSKFSLAAMLWVGFLGASIATYEKRHLALEMGEKLWPAKAARFVRALAYLSAAAMCGLLLYLAVVSVLDHHHTWQNSRHLTGILLLELPIPNWLVFMIFPYTFGVMTLRFLGQHAAALAGRERPGVEKIA
jgi:TRAP-type C4-dicarboxylate transport system permease small subunit